MSPLRVAGLVVAVSTLSAPVAAEPVSGQMRVSVRVVRTCQVASLTSHARVRCSARDAQIVRVQVDQRPPSLQRTTPSGDASVGVEGARRLTIDF